MDMPWNVKRPLFSKSGITFWWFLLSVLIGIVAVIIFGLIGGGFPVAVARPKKWGITLFAGMLVFFYMLAIKDKKRFFLVLLILGLIFGLSKTLLFIPSPVFRTTFGFTIPLMLPPLIMLYLIWALRTITQGVCRANFHGRIVAVRRAFCHGGHIHGFSRSLIRELRSL